MPEAIVPEPKPQPNTTRDTVRDVITWFFTPDDTGNFALPPPLVQKAAEEVRDMGSGVPDAESGAEKAGAKKLAGLALPGRLPAAAIDLLFGGAKAGAPDPPRPFSIYTVVLPGGRRETRALYPGGEVKLIRVEMLPMWNADP